MPISSRNFRAETLLPMLDIKDWEAVLEAVVEEVNQSECHCTGIAEAITRCSKESKLSQAATIAWIENFA